MADDQARTGLSSSICEEALKRFGQSDDSLANMIEGHNIAVRDFMLLSLVCDQNCFDVPQLRRALGLDELSIFRCIERLANAGLVKPDPSQPTQVRQARVCATPTGQALAKRILDSVGEDA